MVGCLVIHGYTGSPDEVQPLVDYLKESTDWDIRVPILPGHGRQLQLKDKTYENWLQEAEHQLGQLMKKHDTVYAIGFSMGGMIAAYLTAKYKLDKLVLLAAARKYISLKQLTIDICKVLLDALKGKLNYNEFYVNLNEKVSDVPLKANIEFLKLVRYTRPYLKEIDSPVLIAHGRQDSIVPAKTTYYLDEEIKSAQKEIVLFDQSNHLICLGKDKDVLNTIVHDFLID